jgi:hypothetical protein
VWAKKFMRLHLNRKKLGMVVHTCYPSYCGKHKMGELGPGQPGQKLTPYLTNNQKKIELEA